jgi:ADP-ribosylglycohydrolase
MIEACEESSAPLQRTEARKMKNVSQEQVLGALLGFCIGDALGMPFVGITPAEIRDQYGVVDRYYSRTFSDGSELKAGEFTDESEILLSIVETYTSSAGELDAELIRARMERLAKGESRRWMDRSTVAALSSEDIDRNAEEEDLPPELAARGVPIGLIHSMRPVDRSAMERDIRVVAAITHPSERAITAALTVAEAVRLSISRSVELAELPTALTDSDIPSDFSGRLKALSSRTDFEAWTAGFESANEIEAVVATAVGAVTIESRFEDSVFSAASAGGPADSRAAIAGAISGAWHGAGGIPQRLIDGLEGRIYIALAAPWFYRTMQLRSGRALEMSAKNLE